MKFSALAACFALSIQLFGGIFSTSTNVTLLSNSRIYVDSSNVGGTEDGSSWATAFSNFQDAIDAATDKDTIWVAKGSYIPSRDTSGADNNRHNLFYLDKNLIILGGFIGIEDQASQRDWTVNKTIFSGDRGIKGDSSDNCYHIMQIHEVDSCTILDGINFQRGIANGTEEEDQRGGALLMITEGNGIVCSPTFINCTFSRNYAESNGGAIYSVVSENAISTPFFKNAQFIRNQAKYTSNQSRGGACRFSLNSGKNVPSFIGCLMESNKAHEGAVFNLVVNNAGQEDTIGLEIYNSEFRMNDADDQGGIVFVLANNGGTSIVNFVRSEMFKNVASAGAVYYGHLSRGVNQNVRINQSEIRGNVAGSGCVVYFQGRSSGNPPIGANLAISNSLIAGNKGSGTGSFLYGRRSGGWNGPFTFELLNTTVARNDFNEGLIESDTLFGSSTSTINSILWENDGEVFNDTSGIKISHSLIHGIYPSGPGNLNGLDSLNDPFFIQPVDLNEAPTIDGDYHLPPCSRLIDAGSNDSLPNGLTVDLDSMQRIQGGTVDLGAYENGEPDTLDFICQDLTVQLFEGQYIFDNDDFRNVLANGSLCYDLTEGPGVLTCGDLNSSPLSVELVGTHLTGTTDTCDIQLTVLNDTLDCCALGDTSGSAFIKSVKVQSALRIIEQLSGDDGGYADYTSDDLVVGPSDSLFITVCGNSEGPDSIKYYRIWIDTNNNDLFEPFELILEDSSTGPVSVWYERTGVVFGTQSMRVAMKTNGYPEVCGAFTGGEVEDYDLKYDPCRSDFFIQDRNVSGFFQAEDVIVTIGDVKLLDNTSFHAEEIFLGEGFEVPPGFSFEVLINPCDD